MDPHPLHNSKFQVFWPSRICKIRLLSSHFSSLNLTQCPEKKRERGKTHATNGGYNTTTSYLALLPRHQPKRWAMLRCIPLHCSSATPLPLIPLLCALSSSAQSANCPSRVSQCHAHCETLDVLTLSPPNAWAGFEARWGVHP